MKVTRQRIMDISRALIQLSVVETEAWYAINRNLSKLKNANAEVDTTKATIWEKLAEKDEKGQVKLNPDGSVEMTEENRTEAQKLWDAFLAEELEIDFYQINIEKIKNEKHPAQLMAPLLEVIIVE